MSDVHRHDTGSALLDEILAERDRIHAAWHQPRILLAASIPSSPPPPLPSPAPPSDPDVVPEFPPLPLPNIKSVEERVAEVDAFRDELPDDVIEHMKHVIRKSAKECACECSVPAANPFGPAIPTIQRIVAEYFDITAEQVISSKRSAHIVLPRQIAMYLSKMLTERSLPDIARRFGGRDHTTVLHAVRKITAHVAEDSEFADEIEMLKGIIDMNEEVVLEIVERKIQRLLLDLDERLTVGRGMRIDHVEVDTRNFSNMKTEIHTVKKDAASE